MEVPFLQLSDPDSKVRWFLAGSYSALLFWIMIAYIAWLIYKRK